MIWSKNVRTGMVINLLLEKGRDIRYEIVPIFLNDEFIPVQFKNRKKFDNLLKFFFKRLKHTYKQNPDRYNKYYQRKRKRNHLWQRIMMKFF